MRIDGMVLLLVVLISCSEKKEYSCQFEYDYKQPKATNIQYHTRQYSIELDSMTPFRLSSLVYNESIDALQFYNGYNNGLYTYKYPESSISRLDTFELKGPNGVGPNDQLEIFQSKNRYVVFNVWEQKIKLFQDPIIKHFEHQWEMDESGHIGNFITTNSYKPQLASDSLVFLTHFPISEDVASHKNISLFNFNTGKSITDVKKPEIYQCGTFGPFAKNVPYRAVNQEKQELIISYPVDPYLYIYDYDLNLVKTSLLNSQFISDIQPQPKNLKNNKDATRKYEFATPAYGPIYFDTHKRLIYRFTYLAVDDDLIHQMINNGIKITKPQSLIVADEDFNILGELQIDTDKYETSLTFIAPTGLHIARKDLYKYDNDKIIFDIFQF